MSASGVTLQEARAIPKGAVHLQHDMITISDLFVEPVLHMNENDLCFSASKMFFSYGLGNSLYFPFRFGASPCCGRKNPTRKRFFRSSTNTNRLSFSPCRPLRALSADREEIRLEFTAHLSFFRRTVAAGAVSSMERAHWFGAFGCRRLHRSDP